MYFCMPVLHNFESTDTAVVKAAESPRYLTSFLQIIFFPHSTVSLQWLIQGPFLMDKLGGIL